MDRSNWFSIGGNNCHAVSFEGDLRGADGTEGVDQSEPVSPARGDGEDLQRGVGHEAGVGVPELSLSVEENVLWVLSRVDGEPAGVPLGGIFVHPIAEEHHVGGQIEVVQMAVGVLGRGLANNNASEETIQFLQTSMGVPEVSSCITSPLISARKNAFRELISNS